jgi:phosphoinositide-3-kinase regulatory subunit 4
MEVWDIETTKLVEIYGTRMVSKASAVLDEPQDPSGGTTEPSAATAIATLVRARQHSVGIRASRDAPSSAEGPSREFVHTGLSLDIRALVVGLEFGGHSTVHRSGVFFEFRRTFNRRAGIHGERFCRPETHALGRRKGRTDNILSGAELENEKPSYRYSPSENTHFILIWGIALLLLWQFYHKSR